MVIDRTGRNATLGKKHIHWATRSSIRKRERKVR